MPEVAEAACFADKVRSFNGCTLDSVQYGALYSRPKSDRGRTVRAGWKISSIFSYGKSVYICSEDDDILTIRWNIRFQFGMSGSLAVIAPDQFLPIHTHAILYFSDGQRIAYVDPRRFGRVSYTQTPKTVFRLVACPLHDKATDLFSRLAAAQTYRPHYSISRALMSQRYVYCGNYMKSDALAIADIHPSTNVSDIDDRRLMNLAHALVEVTRKSYEAGGHTIHTYRGGGYEPVIYGRKEYRGVAVKKLKTDDGRSSYTIL